MMPLVTRSHNREARDKSVTVSVRVMSLPPNTAST